MLKDQVPKSDFVVYKSHVESTRIFKGFGRPCFKSSFPRVILLHLEAVLKVFPGPKGDFVEGYVRPGP